MINATEAAVYIEDILNKGNGLFQGLSKFSDSFSLTTSIHVQIRKLFWQKILIDSTSVCPTASSECAGLDAKGAAGGSGVVVGGPGAGAGAGAGGGGGDKSYVVIKARHKDGQIKAVEGAGAEHPAQPAFFKVRNTRARVFTSSSLASRCSFFVINNKFCCCVRDMCGNERETCHFLYCIADTWQKKTYTYSTCTNCVHFTSAIQLGAQSLQPEQPPLWGTFKWSEE